MFKEKDYSPRITKACKTCDRCAHAKVVSREKYECDLHPNVYRPAKCTCAAYVPSEDVLAWQKAMADVIEELTACKCSVKKKKRRGLV